MEDKQDLLCQAVQAMELEEAEHQKVLSRKDIQISELEEKLDSAHKDTSALTEMNDMLVQKQNKILEESSTMFTEAFNLHGIDQKNQEIEQLQQHINDLETQVVFYNF